MQLSLITRSVPEIRTKSCAAQEYKLSKPGFENGGSNSSYALTSVLYRLDDIKCDLNFFLNIIKILFENKSETIHNWKSN